MRKKVCIGILAHVDAGKTTCIESMLYLSGQIRKLGRVDHQDAFLDYDNQERNRGITIYSKEAHFTWKYTDIYVIDTPGHIDFSSEMERSLQVLDLAILLINGQDGVQSHTQTIWKCLEHYHVPTLCFVNKMDISYHSKEDLLLDLTKKCHSNCIDFNNDDKFEKLALVNEDLLNEYIQNDSICTDSIQQAIYKRECFPVFFGSALKLEGIEPLMDAIKQYSLDCEYGQEFGAKVYKISKDEQGNRLTHIKVTSGCVKPKQIINEEKIDQIRLYNGKNYTMLNQADAGMICVLKGLEHFEVGQGMGIEKDSEKPLLNAYLNYQLVLPSGIDPLQMMKTCDLLCSQDPQLNIEYESQSKKINVQLMGDIQMEVLQNRIEKETGIKVGFTTGNVIYKETITEPVYGVGHFEPLRHYAEVHLKLEPLPRNSGLQFESDVSMDSLALNWQRLILTHLQEKHHKGVLTGSYITDMKITLVAGKSHLKHTEGGDFRQATYRAVRQGLKKAHSILLEPYYSFNLTLDSNSLSKALYDLECRHATVTIEDHLDGTFTVSGRGPVRLLMNYQNDVVAMTKGKGVFTCQLDGYDECVDADKIIEEIGYDSEQDFKNPTGSVFCTHGSGFYVPYDEVEEYMHIKPKSESTSQSYSSRKYTIDEQEVQRVFNMISGQNKKKEEKKPKKKTDISYQSVTVKEKLPECLIVDGYNQIYGWDSLKEYAHSEIDYARSVLISALQNYQGYKNIKVILVFDAYRVKDSTSRNSKYGDMEVIYTKYGQSADSYIEKLVHDYKGKYKMVVASSDGLIQNSILASGAIRMSARELECRVNSVNQQAFNSLKK
ncbi:translation factor GTPase family protein [Floccifex sp.]|uniref:translation factor GTPase family protein n=2 Tax=Floccifex sp. TaxID=2815810 RepID=UPI002A764E78|nr:translation factor GTPase family protein [Floccifex sp.]MDY2959053.1 translation factor GTPase family protein [Floccifex sp.]